MSTSFRPEPAIYRPLAGLDEATYVTARSLNQACDPRSQQVAGDVQSGVASWDGGEDEPHRVEATEAE